MAKPATLTRRSSSPALPPGQLPPRSTTWRAQSGLLAAAGLGGLGAAPLAGHPGLAVPAAVCGAGAGAGRYWLGSRDDRRHQLVDQLVEALTQPLGMTRPSRAAVRARAWTRRSPGHPRKVTVRYSPRVDDTDPAWRGEIVAIVSRRLLADYELRSHDRRRCRLHLVPARPLEDGPATPALLQRAQQSATELFGPTATVADPQWRDDELVGFTVRHSIGAKLAAAGYRRRIEQVVTAMLPGRWRAAWDLENDTATFTVRPSFPASVWIPVRDIDTSADLLASYDSVQIPYGVDEDGELMVWRPAHDPNLMGVGSPGSGKTVLDHTILVEATRHGWPVWVVDGKSIEFLGFQDWPNVQIVATTVAEQVAVIHRAWEVMEHRYDLITSGRASEQDFEPLLVFLDEFADFRSNLMAWYSEIKIKGDPTKPLVLSRVASIARKGRTSRVHLVFTTQRPDAEYFGGDMRDNFRMRISMGRLSPQGAMMMWESPVVGVSIPRGCRGRATTINDANRAVEIQTYRTPDPRKTVDGTFEAELLAQLRPAEARHERLLIVDPWDDVTDRDLDTGEIIDPTYREYAGARWVLARDRPDLDPVAHRTAPSTSGRELSSPMTVFGLSDTAPAGEPAVPAPEPTTAAKPAPAPAPAPVPAPAVSPAGLRAVPDLPSDVDDEMVDVDDHYGYGPTSTTPAGRIKAGDLVLVDEDSGQWAVVDAEPEDDVADPGCIALSWRGDADEAGYLSVPADDLIAVRRPLEENQ